MIVCCVHFLCACCLESRSVSGCCSIVLHKSVPISSRIEVNSILVCNGDVTTVHGISNMPFLVGCSDLDVVDIL